MNADVIAAVEACSDQQWRATCADEGWSVAVTAHHIASGHEAIAGLAARVANQEGLPTLTPGLLGGSPFTVEQMIERILIGHPPEHLASIQRAMGG